MMGPGFAYMPGMGWMMFGSFVFWALLVAVGVYAVVQLGRPADQRGNAKAILDERLARGDIDQEEYRSRA